MKRFFAIVIFIVAAAMVGYGIKYVATPLGTVDAVVTDEEKSISGKGVIIREEQVYYANGSGTVYYNVTEGSRVSKDTLVSTVYSGSVNSDVLKELHNLDRKIEKASHIREEYASDIISVESEIASRSADIINSAEDNDIASITQYKDDINRLRQGEDITRIDRVKELQYQKGELEKAIGSDKSEIHASISGVFTTYLDNLEGELRPDAAETYTADYIKSLDLGEREDKSKTEVNSGDPVCKVVNNHVWYVAVPIEADKLNKIEKNTPVQVRFKNMANEKIKGSIDYIGEADENGLSVVMVKCPSYFESAYSYREADIDIIFENYTGYKVPIHAVYTDENGNHSVIGEIGKTQYKCAVNVLYSDTDKSFAVVESTEDAENKLSRMERIVIGER